MTREYLSLDWGEVDPRIRGPWSVGESRVTFEVSERSERVLMAPVSSGPAWPDGPERLARLVAVPEPQASAPVRSEDIVLSLEDADGRPLPLCVRSGEGSVRWLVDPRQWIEVLLHERYVEDWTRPLPSRLPLLNYNRAPSFLKRILQPSERLTATRSNPVAFPAVPLDDLVEVLRRLCQALATSADPEPCSLWPNGARAAVTLCHDVDTAWILETGRAEILAEILQSESSLGYSGAWYVTAAQLDVGRHAAAIGAIDAAGQELGAHGWSHDAKLDYLPAARQRRRLERARARFDSATPCGIRTPWYCRSPQLMTILREEFAYSCSVPNASAFFSAASNSGCCSVFPFEAPGGLFELPMTLPPDTALPAEDLETTLLPLVERIVELGGVIVLTLHPQSHQSANPIGLAAWSALLEAIVQRHGDALWHATPREIVERYQSAIGAR